MMVDVRGGLEGWRPSRGGNGRGLGVLAGTEAVYSRMK